MEQNSSQGSIFELLCKNAANGLISVYYFPFVVV